VSERATTLELATAQLCRERARRRVVRLADGVIANSDAGAAYWRGVLRSVPVVMIDNALPFDDLARATPAECETAGIPPDAEVVLYAGRFVQEKNVELLAEIVGRLLAIRPNTWFVACGDGPLFAPFSRALGDHPRARLLGFRDDVWSWMKRADAMLSTSNTEGQPNSVLEAMACGCPVVLTDIRQHQVITSTDCAFLFASGSADEGVSALSSALDDRPEARRRADVARLRVSSRSIDALVARHEDFYSVISSRSRAPFRLV
jgi:glycosyltransferase involved in cell wall biosynthesis